MAYRGTKKTLGEISNDLTDRARGANPEMDEEPEGLSRYQSEFWDECIRYNHALKSVDRINIDLLLPHIDDIKGWNKIVPSLMVQLRSIMSDLYLSPSSRAKFMEKPKRDSKGNPSVTVDGSHVGENDETDDADDDSFVT